MSQGIIPHSLVGPISVGALILLPFPSVSSPFAFSMTVKITIVGTSHTRRLKGAILEQAANDTDAELLLNFGLQQAHVTFICRGGWTLTDVRQALPRIVSSKPDFLVVHVGSNDLSSASYVDSIKVANNILELANELCQSSGAQGAIIAHLLQRGLSPRLPHPDAVAEYNQKIILANKFITEVLGAGLEPRLISWPHKGMTRSMTHLLCHDGTHVNEEGQLKLYRSLRGAVMRAAKETGFSHAAQVIIH